MFEFQSTLPTRGSDRWAVVYSVSVTDFNPRSPRGGATGMIYNLSFIINISIHAPHEGERPDLKHHRLKDIVFQSTLPTRGSDKSVQLQSARYKDFNPRSPRGGATAPHSRVLRCQYYFNPRSPRGGATQL